MTKQTEASIKQSKDRRKCRTRTGSNRDLGTTGACGKFVRRSKTRKSPYKGSAYSS